MPELINKLKDILGAENVLDSGLDFLSSDVNGLDKVAALAIKPMSSDELSKAVKVITDHNYTVIAEEAQHHTQAESFQIEIILLLLTRQL